MKYLSGPRVVILCVGLLAIAGWSQTAKPQGEPDVAVQNSTCNDSIKSCKEPVKYVSKDDGCYIFACEHGTSHEHLIKTNEEAKVKALMDLSQKSESKEKTLDENRPK